MYSEFPARQEGSCSGLRASAAHTQPPAFFVDEVVALVFWEERCKYDIASGYYAWALTSRKLNCYSLTLYIDKYKRSGNMQDTRFAHLTR